MTASFTPGPWVFNGGDSAPIIHIYAPDNKHVFHESRPLAEQEASARLIAAAPGLYGIVKDVAEHFEGTDSQLGMRARSWLAAVRGGE